MCLLLEHCDGLCCAVVEGEGSEACPEVGFRTVNSRQRCLLQYSSTTELYPLEVPFETDRPEFHLLLWIWGHSEFCRVYGKDRILG